jgi:hypothetical protein
MLRQSSQYRVRGRDGVLIHEGVPVVARLDGCTVEFARSATKQEIAEACLLAGMKMRRRQRHIPTRAEPSIGKPIAFKCFIIGVHEFIGDIT